MKIHPLLSLDDNKMYNITIRFKGNDIEFRSLGLFSTDQTVKLTHGEGPFDYDTCILSEPQIIINEKGIVKYKYIAYIKH